MTALTDSEEEELSDAEQREEQPADQLSILLERIDCLHHGAEHDKRESLSILLGQREEVCNSPRSSVHRCYLSRSLMQISVS